MERARLEGGMVRKGEEIRNREGKVGDLKKRVPVSSFPTE